MRGLGEAPGKNFEGKPSTLAQDTSPDPILALLCSLKVLF